MVTLTKKRVTVKRLFHQVFSPGHWTPHVVLTLPAFFRCWLLLSYHAIYCYICVSWVSSNSTETAQGAHHLHSDTAGHPGSSVLQDPVPRHLYEGGSGPEDQPARVAGAGTQPDKSTCAPSLLTAINMKTG